MKETKRPFLNSTNNIEHDELLKSINELKDIFKQVVDKNGDFIHSKSHNKSPKPILIEHGMKVLIFTLVKLHIDLILY